MKINKRRSTIPKSTMGIASPTASHLPVLEEAASRVGDGLVIEHGAGLYSTPLLAGLGCRVLCVEPHKGWAEWARWIYCDEAEMVESANLAMPRLSEATVVFLDGPAKERGPLLQAALHVGVPTIIAHDTQKREWSYYDFNAAMFEHPRYEVSHHAEDSHRTTLWKLR
jgi:hypothetical protein